VQNSQEFQAFVEWLVSLAHQHGLNCDGYRDVDTLIDYLEDEEFLDKEICMLIRQSCLENGDDGESISLVSIESLYRTVISNVVTDDEDE